MFNVTMEPRADKVSNERVPSGQTTEDTSDTEWQILIETLAGALEDAHHCSRCNWSSARGRTRCERCKRLLEDADPAMQVLYHPVPSSSSSVSQKLTSRKQQIATTMLETMARAHPPAFLDKKYEDEWSKISTLNDARVENPQGFWEIHCPRQIIDKYFREALLGQNFALHEYDPVDTMPHTGSGLAGTIFSEALTSPLIFNGFLISGRSVSG